MNKLLKRTLCMMIAMILTVSSVDIRAFAQEDNKELQDVIGETAVEADDVLQDGEVITVPVEVEETVEKGAEEESDSQKTDTNETSTNDSVAEVEDVEDSTVIIENNASNIDGGNYDIDGDGVTDIVWSVNASGHFEATGNCPAGFTSWLLAPWFNWEVKQNIITAKVSIKNAPKLDYFFHDYPNVKSIDISGTDTSKVASMVSMFSMSENLEKIEFGNIDTSKVTNFSSMFEDCKNLVEVDVSKFDTSSAIYMDKMFSNCQSVKKLDVSGFNTSNVYSMEDLFAVCSSLESLDVSHFDTSNVITMNGMFSCCSSLTKLDVSHFNTANVTDMGSMFTFCFNLTELNIAGLDTSQVTKMGNMFSGCENLESLDVSGLNTSNVKDFSYMFWSCWRLEQLDVTHFDTSSAEDMSNMFTSCYALKAIDVSHFDTSKVKDLEGFFSYCTSLTEIDISMLDTSSCSDIQYMFEECTNLEKVNVSGLKTSKAYSLSRVFYKDEKLQSLDLSSWDLSGVQYVDSTFWGCDRLDTIYAPKNLKMDVELPVQEGDKWYISDGSVVDCLPKKLSKTCVIKRNEIPEEDILDVVWGDIKWSLINGTLYVSGEGAIPDSTLSNKPSWDDYSNRIKKVVIEEGVTGIGNRAFYAYEKIEQVEMADTVTRIGKSAFYANRNLSDIQFSDKLTTIEEYAFAKCSKFETFDVPLGVTTLSESVLQDCNNIEYINLHKGVTSIGFNSITGCKDPLVVNYPGSKSEFESINVHTIIKGLISEGSIIVLYGDGGEYNIKIHAGNADLMYDAASFSGKSSQYNATLAKFSIGLSAMVYNYLSREDGEKLTKTVQGFEGLGFHPTEKNDEFFDNHYYPDTSLDEDNNNEDNNNEDNNNGVRGLNAPAWIVNRTLLVDGKETTIICVVIRGTDSLEWIDNFDSGNGTTHVGFDRAADFVLKNLNSYIKDNEIGSDGKPVKILVTGHSRGAAVANLLGKKLNNACSGKSVSNTEYIKKLPEIGKDNIYVYTYATPNVTKDSARETAEYNNIYNILNPEDFVTKVMPVKWGYGRYGRTYVLPSKNAVNAFSDVPYEEGVYDFHTYLRDVKIKYSQHSNGEDMYKPYWEGMTDVTDYVNRVVKTVDNVEDYYTECLSNDPSLKRPHELLKSDRTGMKYDGHSLFDLFTETLGYHQAGGDYEGVGTGNFIVAAVPIEWGSIGSHTFGFFFAHQIFRKEFLWAHSFNTYLAMMETVSTNMLQIPKYYDEILVNCPVDVVIKDAGGNVVASSKTGYVDENLEGLSLNVEGEAKSVFLPGEGNYTVEAIGYDEGTMDYSVVRYDPDLGEIARKVYLGEPVSEGKKYTETLSCGEALEDIKLYTDGDMLVTDGVIIPADEIGKLKVETEAIGRGRVSATGCVNLTQGDHVMLTAVPDEINEFIGFYDTEDNLLSEDKEYGLSVKENTKIIAKFTDIPGDLWVAPIPDEEYTGAQIKPSVQVYEGNVLLKEGVDYTVKYSNNTNVYKLGEGETIDGVNFDAKKAPTVTVTGKGNYKDKECVYFKINPADIASEKVTVADPDTVLEGKSVVRPKLKLTLGKKALAINKDYTLKYYKNYNAATGSLTGELAEKDGPKMAGTYYILAQGMGNFEGKVVKTFKIDSSDKKLISKLTVSKISDKAYNDGKELKLTKEEISTLLKDGNDYLKGEEIPAGMEVGAYSGKADYLISYSANITDPGVVTVTLTGRGAKYTGKRTITYKITGVAISKAYLDAQTIVSCTYDGAEKAQDGMKLYESKADGAKKLVKGIDYEVSYMNNTNVGTATMVITGKGKYTGTMKTTFKISPYNVTEDQSKSTKEQKIHITYIDNAKGDFAFVKGGVKPVVTVMFDGVSTPLVEKKDYTLAYKNHTKINMLTSKDSAFVASKAPSVVITMKGNYVGKVSKYFTIHSKAINSEDIKVTVKDVPYKNAKGAWKSIPELTDKDGKKLQAGTDYDKNHRYFYDTIPEGCIIYDGSGRAPAPLNRKVGDEVKDTDIVPKDVVIRVVTKANGTNYSGERNEKMAGKTGYDVYRIIEEDIAKAKVVMLHPIVYTGKVITLSDKDIKVTVGSGKNTKTLTLGTDYEIVESTYKNNINKGKASVIIRGINKFGGTKDITFNIGQKGFVWWFRNMMK